MQEDIREKIREVAQRAGVRGVSPRALAAAVAVCTVVLVASVWHFWPSRGSSEGLALESSAGSSGPPRAASSETSDRAGSEESRNATVGVAYVHVVGAVRRPGLYQLAAGARLADAIAAAGGLLSNAAERGINLARQVSDGEQILVLTQDEFEKYGAPALGGVTTGQATAGGSPSSSAPVDINSADAEALDALPGIGPSTAAKIIADREANGPYSSPEDLGRVSGIGPKKLETLLGLIVAR